MTFFGLLCSLFRKTAMFCQIWSFTLFELYSVMRNDAEARQSCLPAFARILFHRKRQRRF